MSTQHTLAPCFTPPFAARLVPQRHHSKDYHIASISAKGYMPIANVYHPSNNNEDANKNKIIEIATLFAAAPELLAGINRITFAAMSRENIMGDPCSLINAKAELQDAIRQANEAIAKATTPQ